MRPFILRIGGWLAVLLVALAGIACGQDMPPSIDKLFPSQAGRGAPMPPIVRERTEYYDIRGSKEYDLQCELKAKGCEWIDGKTYDSMTTWEFAWDYDYIRSSGSCVAKDFRVTVNIVFRYPRWLRDETAPHALVQKWNIYMEALVHHETGHRDMALQTATALVRDVNAQPPARDCEELDLEIKRICRSHIEQLEENTKAYDSGTVHGGTQGAVLE